MCISISDEIEIRTNKNFIKYDPTVRKKGALILSRNIIHTTKDCGMVH